MNKKRCIVAIITKEKGTLYLTSWGKDESFLVKDKTRAFGYYDVDLAKSACRAGKKLAERQGLTVVYTAVLEDYEHWTIGDLPKAKPQKIEPDAVHSPAHYQLADGLEAIDVIDQVVEDPASFYRGNAIKYLLRAGRKGDAREDLRKARYYIDRELGHE
ncbi:DUF3310 domain-containing protein [Corynebacterium pseudodiphtheriticum]|uniref:DUF3310 domain-containing protein n=1 Tax=Corynebacterium pseudodiphtheriticum TaxID=37637 RepID=UPI00254D72F3|nr:DUF3310 domain-containing protein [Corynebacterium pseudodiphtheriticum]MDK8500664.1 DUF3310 domain-containing protein [Corynebacterium pseudodiphtheriticum]MDK8775776.1 DUF3310 domain-containing protein [Corynebacterium pseudodiphtheriticum]